MGIVDPLRVDPYKLSSQTAQDHTLLADAWIEPAPDINSVQRAVEVLISTFALLFASPVIAVMAIIIKLDSPGPAFFGQWRLGKGGKPFWFVKMRTLYANARGRWPELYAYDYTPEQLDQLYFKVPNDPRVTRVGKWLRRSTLDELPNFWHVLTGDMAFVGPRPEIPEMLRYYGPDERKKFSVRPGITGLAQISGRGRLNFRETTRLDVLYVDSRSSSLDTKIIVRTLRGLITQDGAF